MTRARVLGALTAVAVLAIGGCSSSSMSSPSATSSDADLCGSADELRSSINELQNMQVGQDGTDAVRQAFTDVGHDVNRLVDDARGEFSEQVAPVESAAGDVRAALNTLAGSPSAAALDSVRAAVQTLVQNAGVLIDDVGSTC